MGKRVNNGPGDDPDEYYFECDDCEGTGKVSIPEPDQEPVEDVNGKEQYQYWMNITCANCDGLGYVEGDADDVEF